MRDVPRVLSAIVEVGLLRAALLGIAGCGANGPTAEEVRSLQSETSGLATDEEAHRAAMASAASVDEAVATEARHAIGMVARFDALQSVLVELGRCSAGVRELDTSATHDALQDIRSEWQFHRSVIVLATSLDEIARDEDRHAYAVEQEVADLRSAGNALLDRARDYDCSP